MAARFSYGVSLYNTYYNISAAKINCGQHKNVEIIADVRFAKRKHPGYITEDAGICLRSSGRNVFPAEQHHIRLPG